VLIREQEVDSVTGRQVTVKVVQGGREIKEIERPLHVEDGQRSVVFRRKHWPLKPGNRIVIDEPPLAEKGEARSETPRSAPGITPRPTPKISP